METVMATCSTCGSTKAAIYDAKCINRGGCERRRITRRVEADRARGGKQCMSSRGSTSIRFCTMREGHDGKHTDGGLEWGSDKETTVGRAFADAFRK